MPGRSQPSTVRGHPDRRSNELRRSASLEQSVPVRFICCACSAFALLLFHFILAVPSNGADNPTAPPSGSAGAIAPAPFQFVASTLASKHMLIGQRRTAGGRPRTRQADMGRSAGGTAAGAPPIGALSPAIGACGCIWGGAAISFAAAIEGGMPNGWNCGLPCTGTPVPAETDPVPIQLHPAAF